MEWWAERKKKIEEKAEAYGKTQKKPKTWCVVPENLPFDAITWRITEE